MAKQKKTAGAAVQPQQVTIERKINSIPDPRMVATYSNNVNLDLSNIDLRLRFGQIQAIAGDTITVLETAHVYMTHEHARLLHARLTDVLGKIGQLPRLTDEPKA